LLDERPDFAKQPVGFFRIAEFVDILHDRAPAFGGPRSSASIV
jgi:hypothetical protein